MIGFPRLFIVNIIKPLPDAEHLISMRLPADCRRFDYEVRNDPKFPKMELRALTRVYRRSKRPLDFLLDRTVYRRSLQGSGARQPEHGTHTYFS